uniref:Atonal n=1 Tax=Schmidtea polychroa TaxID=50054 RepID=H6V051_SCHPL|nr:atonal [Schmidtea polychroa]
MFHLKLYKMANYCNSNKQPCQVSKSNPIKRTAANDRERKRMYCLNRAFDQLRDVVPYSSNQKKMSKFETLLMAQTYIETLVEMLEN